MTKWTPYPYPSFGFSADNLAEHWDILHAGDTEPFPDAERVEQLRNDYSEISGQLDGHDSNDIAATLQAAWAAFHNGDFASAAELGHSIGTIGAPVAAKATGIYASRLADNDQRLALLGDELETIQTAADAMANEANAHYFLAFLLGRYSQEISIAKALTEGLAGRVRKALDHVLELRPDHAEAQTALGVYHAEIVDKVGGLVAKLTYGANPRDAKSHGTKALELTPNAPIAWIEYGNILLMTDGDKAMDEAVEAYEKAASMEPNDAMEKLDIQYAAEQIEDE